MLGMLFKIGYTCLQFAQTIVPSSTWIFSRFTESARREKGRET